MKQKITRRDFCHLSFKGLGVILTASAIGTTATGCKRGNNSTANVDAKEVFVAPCPDQKNLTEQARSIRATLRYVDQSPRRDRRCDNCKLYTLPKNSEVCGGCKVVPGPIHGPGYCTAWVPQM